MVEKRKSKKNLDLVQYGSIVFGVGLLMAFIMAFVNLGAVGNKVVFATLVVLGIVIGFLNIKNSESVTFLVSTIALVLLAGPFLGLVSQNIFQSPELGKIFANIIALIVPAAIVVSLKEIFVTAKDE